MLSMYIFVVSNRIHNLVTYLQEFCSLGLPNANHTTLLLNTYTKLKDIVHLDSFIRDRKSGDDDTDELPFDPDIAILVCPQAGYFKQERHEDYLRIQIEDARNFMDALMHLRKLDPEVAEKFLAQYGRSLLESAAEDHPAPYHLRTNSGPLSENVVIMSPTKQVSEPLYKPVNPLTQKITR